jgi:transposase
MLWSEFDRVEKQVLAMARCDTRARLLMSVPGVGAIVSLTFAAAIDDPARFKSWSLFRPDANQIQSGETDIDGRISKIGDASVRTVLYEAANIILTKPLKGCTKLKSWAMKLARRSRMKEAKVALAPKIAVIMHRMLVDGTSFCNVTTV